MGTIREVAEYAGVSVATVSRVINGDPVVKPSTRSLVLDAVEKLHYTPNLLGRNLRQARTNRILVLIPSISNQFYSKIITAMEKTAKADGYRVLVCMTHNDPATERGYIEMLRTRVVDGIVFFSSCLGGGQMNSLAEAFPVVQCCEYVQGSHTDAVLIDNEQAAYDAVNRLLDSGYRSIAFFGSKVRYTSGILREKGYRRALAERQGQSERQERTGGSGADEGLLFFDDYSYPGGQRMAAASLKAEKRPDAVFCISDSMAIGCIRELTDRGVRVPEDIAVMGFDDTSIAKVFCPAISTVAQPQADTGRIAAEMIIGRLRDGARPARTEILPHRIVARQTTRNCAAGDLAADKRTDGTERRKAT